MNTRTVLTNIKIYFVFESFIYASYFYFRKLLKLLINHITRLNCNWLKYVVRFISNKKNFKNKNALKIRYLPKHIGTISTRFSLEKHYPCRFP